MSYIMLYTVGRLSVLGRALYLVDMVDRTIQDRVETY